MYLVPVNVAEVNPDWTEADCILMDLGVDSDGFAKWCFHWKTNSANGNGQLYAANSQILLTNPTPLGKWTLSFPGPDDQHVRMTAPGGNNTNFVMGVHPNVPDISGNFIDTGGNGVVYLGVYAGETNVGGLSAVLADAQISGLGVTSVSNNWLADTTLTNSRTRSVWVPVGNSAWYLVPTNNAWWVNWTLPDWGFALQTNSNLSQPAGWSTNGLPAGMIIGDKKRVLIKPGDLPDSPQMFFRLSKPGY